ncbi:SDR family oxidoreductase [Kribbella sp. NBC_01505]|uniref:SDR family NAD(P)-dependent oxidoreductase n=1 Tax=Kribbella sp. NBC_01505 TaxID=2903580 RepID=UPI0038641EC5
MASAELGSEVALVTGATGVIGRAIAAEFGARGAAVLVTGRRKEVLDEVADGLRRSGVRVEAVVGDVTDPVHVEEAVATANEALGPVTTLVNNAGAAEGMATVADSDPSDWRDTLLSNVYGPFLFAHAVLPSMLAAGRGRIITVASRAGTAVVPGSSSYVVSKTAVIRLSEAIAVETQGTGVTAFSLHPGGIPNPSVEGMIERGLVPRDRFPDRPDDAARMIADLASGRYDVLSGAYLDLNDNLDEVAELAARQTPVRILRVTDLPDDFHAVPMF